MKIETLVAAVDQHDHSLAAKMNLRTDALIGNQCGRNSTETFELNGCRITYLNTAERGVGKNRNLLLDSSEADICILADDDMKFVDDCPRIAARAFEECPDADVLVFNLIEKRPVRYINKKITRVRRGNYARYGAARIALKRNAVMAAGIRFSLLFGGGAMYGSGEDTLFLQDCLSQGLKIYAVPYALAEIDQSAESTWFKGYDRKFFTDKGALYAALHPVLWRLYALRFLVRYRHKFGKSVRLGEAFGYMTEGGREYAGTVGKK